MRVFRQGPWNVCNLSQFKVYGFIWWGRTPGNFLNSLRDPFQNPWHKWLHFILPFQDTAWWFDKHISCEMIATINLTHVSPHIVTVFVCVVRMIKMYSPSKFEVCRILLLTELLTIIMLYLRSLELTHKWKFVPFDQHQLWYLLLPSSC